MSDAHVMARDQKTQLGFWIYLMTDCILFGSVFATYIVLRSGTNGGPSGADLFDLPFVMTETVILLASSLTCGLALLMARHHKLRAAISLLVVTMLLGGAFLAMELVEFTHLVSEGHSWQASAFLSAFFTLVGMHGAHIAVGLIWLLVLTLRLVWQGSNVHMLRRLSLAAMFWHFLDVVWIFIFTIVYFMGVI
jgi:cytochrome o ubiquinol oxidase subunit III